MSGFSSGHALLIGVGGDLPTTVGDAEAIGNLLSDQRRAGYPRAQVETLTGTAATRAGIIRGLEALAARCLADPTATAVVYYSGHGGRFGPSEDEARYFIVPWGFDPLRREETGISGVELSAAIQQLHAKKLLVLLDCCHAAGLPRLKAPGRFAAQSVPVELMTELGGGSGRVVLASCRPGELSRAGDPYSLFTAALLEALAGKGSVRRGTVRVLDAIAYVMDQVPARQPDQHPFLNRIDDLTDNFAICVAPASAAVPAAALPAWKLASLRCRRDSLLVPHQLLTDKIGRLRVEHAASAGGAFKFQLESEIRMAERELADLEAKLLEIDGLLPPD